MQNLRFSFYSFCCILCTPIKRKFLKSSKISFKVEPTLEPSMAHSFIINIYYILTYDSINRNLKDLTTYMCFRAPQKAIQTPLKMHFWAFLTNFNSKTKHFE